VLEGLDEEEEDGDYSGVPCSACGSARGDDANDILFCDGDGCLRAYHQVSAGAEVLCGGWWLCMA
jgi:hypothetical protein